MTRFVRNPAFKAEMLADPELIAQTHKTTEEVGVEVKRAAEPFRNTGYYIRHLRVDGNLVIGGDPFSHLVEAGSVNNPPYAPLRRGARAAGLRLVDPEAH